MVGDFLTNKMNKTAQFIYRVYWDKPQEYKYKN